MGTPWRARALINFSALRFNLQAARKAAPESKILAVVKADAYGHGLTAVTHCVAPLIDGYAVATVSEGVCCRQINHDKRIVVLSEFWNQEQLAIFAAKKLDPVVHSQYQVDWLQHYKGPPLDLWVKLDTGMNRFGMDADQFVTACKQLHGNPCIAAIRLMSHFANAEVPGDRFTEMQWQKFTAVAHGFSGERSMANSAGILADPKFHFEWVRAGIMLYGVSPMETDHTETELQPVMELQGRIVSVKPIAAGDSIGYGRTYTANAPMKIAVVSLGYGDGYPRVVSSQACVMLKNQCAPIVGRVSMDVLTIDVSLINSVNIGDIVTLWGDSLRVEKVAGWANTIAYELLCRVSGRVPRIYIPNQVSK